jgi:ankyrin repeat protein
MASLVQDAWDAVQLDNVEALKALVPGSVSANASTCNPANPIHTLLQCAAAHGAAECAEFLIASGANVHAKNFSGFTALHWSAYSGRLDTVPLLLAKGADIDARTDDGRTAFHIAASRGHLQYLVELAKAKPDLEAVSSQGWTALHFAVAANQRKTAQWLAELGVREDGPDAQGKTLADVAKEYEREWFADLLPAD